MAFVSECLNALAPCQKHVFSKIAKLGVLSDGFMDMWGGVGDGLADGFDHGNLLPKGDSEFQSNEVFEVFSRAPCLLAHKGNARRLVLIARVDHCGQQIVGRREAHIGLAGVEECQIFRMSVRVAQGIGQEKHEGELTEGLALGWTRNMVADCFRDTLPSGVVFFFRGEPQKTAKVLHA